MVIFIFQDGGRRHLECLKFQILTIGIVKKVKLCHRAKFCRNRSNRSRDMVILRFFKMATAAILDFWNLKFLTVNGRNGQEGRTASACQNFVEIARTVAEICEFQYYASLAWKCLFTPLLEGFWGTFPPNDVTHRPNPKRTVLGLNHVIWAIKREYRSPGSSWALVREKKDRTGKSHKRVIFHVFVEKPPLKRCTWKFV